MKDIYFIVKNKLNSARLNFLSYKRKNRLMHETDLHNVAHLIANCHCNHSWYGNNYGGFYINPDHLKESSVIYSFGIGKDVSFDRACIKKHQSNVFAFDPTPKSIEWIRKQDLPEKFHFYDYGICVSGSGLYDFYLPVHPKGVSGSIIKQKEVNESKSVKVWLKTFGDIASELKHDHIDVLKMDIEGAEYLVLEDILESHVTIDQILVEFHDRNFDPAEYKSKMTVEKLRDKGYCIFGCSQSYEEVSFIHKNKLRQDNFKY